MIHIALCDDNGKYLNALHRTIEYWFREKGSNYSVIIQDFSSSEYLASTLKESSYDILFLDIEMPGLDGMALAKKVRDKLPSAIIIFLTSHDEFAPDGYKVQALRYISKLAVEEQLEEALTAAMQEFEKLENGALSVTNYGNLSRVPYRDIIYIRHILRSSQISTVNFGTIKDNRGIKELYTAIGDERFIFIDRGTFINLDFLQRIEDSRAILRNGESLMISRRMLPQVKLTVNRILGG